MIYWKYFRGINVCFLFFLYFSYAAVGDGEGARQIRSVHETYGDKYLFVKNIQT